MRFNQAHFRSDQIALVLVTTFISVVISKLFHSEITAQRLINTLVQIVHEFK